MDGLISKLAEQSVVGAILAISMGANYFLFRIVQELQEKRLVDAKEVSASIIKPIDQIDQNSKLLISLLQKILDGGGSKNGN